MAFRLLALAVALFGCRWSPTVMAAGPRTTAAAADEEKPYKIAEDGTVDWPTFSGFRRYNSDLPCLPWSRRRRQHLRAGPGRIPEDACNYEQFTRDRGQRQDRGEHGGPEEDAGLRHRPQRHVLSRRHLRLSEGHAPTASSAAAARPSMRTKSAGGGGSRGRLHGQLAGATMTLRALWHRSTLWPPRCSRGGSAPSISRRRSTAPRCASARIPATCRSPTRRARASRTRSPSCSPAKLGVPVHYTWYPATRSASCATRCGRAAATS